MIRLEKYSASGNDFLVTHFGFPSSPLSSLPSSLIPQLCDRHRGIGADGLVLLAPHDGYAYEWEFYNSDGSRAGMCGNASRCVGLYAFLHALAPKKHSFLSAGREIGIEVREELYPYRVRSILGSYKLLGECKHGGIAWKLIDTGVPHLTALVSKEEFISFPLSTMRDLRNQYDANVNLAYEAEGVYHIKTYERGVEDITLACGTGMASLVAFLEESQKLHLDSIFIIPPFGEKLEFKLQNRILSFEGEVKRIAACHIDPKDYGIRIAE